MKLREILGIALAPMVLLSGCDNIFGLDNYDEPDSMLSGRLTFEGEPVNVRSGGIELELWEPAFELNTKIPVYVAQDGSFSAALFAGDYKLNAIRGQGPWLVTDDTLQIAVAGETTRDFPVTPYYVVETPSFAYAPPPAGAPAAFNGGRINATFSIRTVNATRQLQMAALYVSTTSFADRNNRVNLVETQRTALPANWATAPITLGVNLPTDIRLTPSPAPRTHVQARIGLQVAGIQEMIFSPLVEIEIPATP
jgi:hypothetical protein